MERPTWYMDPETGVNLIKEEKEKEYQTSQEMSIPATSDDKIEDETEIQEEFCAVMERIKSEAMEIADTKLAVLDEGYQAKRSEQSPELMPQSSNDASLLLRCRLCAIQNDDMIDIFGSKEEDIPEMIKRCLPIVVKETDTLPKRACWVCLDRLQLCYQFNRIVAKAESQLLALDGRARINVDEAEKNCQRSSGTVQCDATVHPNNGTTPLCRTTQNAKPLIAVRKGLTVAETVKSCPDLTRSSVGLTATDSQPGSLHSNDSEEDGRGSSSDYGHNDADSSMDDSDSGETLVSHINSQSTYESRVSRLTSSVSRTNKKHLLKMNREKENEDVHRSGLETHTLSHTGENLWQCDHCKRRFNSQFNLKSHLSVCNPQTKFSESYQCSICGKAFSSQTVLSRHYRFHTGVKLEICEYCDEKFTSKAMKDRHRLTHTTESPFKCTICDKGFIALRTLRKHARVHKNEKDYACSLCDKSFKSPYACKKHVLDHKKSIFL